MSDKAGCWVWCYNHHTLVSNVYPPDVSSETPNSSALSLLLFYAASKPQKLPKMGALLEKRAVQDLRAKRTGRIKVLLQVLDSLVKDCSQNLQLFSKSVLRILTDILASDFDETLIPRACQSFVCFNEFFPKEVGLGPVVMEFYTQLVRKMVSLSEHPTGSAKWRDRRSYGLKGLHSVCLSDQLFKKAAMERYGVSMAPVLLNNFAGKDEASLGKTDTLPSMGPHKGSSLGPTMSLKSRGQETLKALFTNLPSSAFKPVLSAVLAHLDASGAWDQTEFVVDTIKLIQAATPSSNHYILLACLLDRFKDVPGKLSLQHRVSLVSCLSYMVIQGGNPITLAHLELLEVFVKHLEWTSDSSTTKTTKTPATLDNFSHLLISSTGNLILSLSYPNQLNDMTHYLTSRLFEAKHKKPLLECVDALLSSRMSLLEPPSTAVSVTSPDKSYAPVAHAPISFDVLQPVLAFYNDDHEATRVLVFSILDKALKLDFKVSHSYPTEADTSFSADLKSAIQDRLAVSSNGATVTKPSLPVDFAIASTLLIHSCRVFGYKEVSRVVYFVLSLQDELTAGPGGTMQQREMSSRQRAVCNVALTVLLELAKWLENKGLEEYFSNMKGERVASGQWEPGVEVGAGCVEALKGKTFADIEGAGFGSLNQVDLLLIREDVLGAFREDPRLTPYFTESLVHSAPMPVPHNTIRLSHSTTGYSQWKKLGGGSIRSTTKSDLPSTTVRIEELRDALLTGTQPSTVFEESSFTAGLDQALSSIAQEQSGGLKAESERKAELGSLLDSITASVTALDGMSRGGSSAGTK